MPAFSGSLASALRPPALPRFPPFLPLLVVSLLITCARSDHPGAAETSTAIRLPSEGAATGDRQNICPPSPQAAACPVRCFRTDPVCGEDGVTYWCGCADAACAGVPVAKMGFCEVGNGGHGLVSGQALLLVHIVWLIVLGFSVVFGVF